MSDCQLVIEFSKIQSFSNSSVRFHPPQNAYVTPEFRRFVSLDCFRHFDSKVLALILLLNDGGFELMYRSPVEVQLESVTWELFTRVQEGRVKRVVIDALGDLERSSLDRQRFADFIYALTQWFAAKNVTCLMT